MQERNIALEKAQLFDDLFHQLDEAKLFLELAEEENADLREAIDDMTNQNGILVGHIAQLQMENKRLIKEYNNLVDIKKRFN